jgi:hypothetical protein
MVGNETRSVMSNKASGDAEWQALRQCMKIRPRACSFDVDRPKSGRQMAGRFAFDSDRSDPNPNDDVGINDVFTVHPDGSDIVNLTRSHGFSGDPGWSPDGSSIVFESDRGAYPRSRGST